MSTPAVAEPIGFALRVPQSWSQFDVWRATRTGDLARMVDARIANVPELVPHRAALLRLMREAAQSAERHGAQLCAVSGDLGEEGEPMLAATAMVFQTEGSPDPTANTVEAIAGQITSTAAVEGSPHWRRVELIEIPAGRAVRVCGLQATEFDGPNRTADIVTMQTLIPVPGGNGVLNVVLTSPQVSLAEPMLDLFDAITATLTWS